MEAASAMTSMPQAHRHQHHALEAEPHQRAEEHRPRKDPGGASAIAGRRRGAVERLNVAILVSRETTYFINYYMW